MRGGVTEGPSHAVPGHPLQRSVTCSPSMTDGTLGPCAALGHAGTSVMEGINGLRLASWLGQLLCHASYSLHVLSPVLWVV